MATVVACACGGGSGGGSGSTTAQPNLAPVGVLGSYAFAERVPTYRGETVPLEGEFTVLRDTVTVRTSVSSCLYNLTSTRGGPLNYDCGEVSFAFDRFDPVHRTTYRMKVRYSEPTQVCAQYTTDAAGRQRCVSYRTEFVEREVVRTGRLNPRRSGEGDVS
jgi:hypothetical protein